MTRRRARSDPRGRLATVVVLVVLGLVGGACVGERPELIATTTSPPTTDSSTGAPVTTTTTPPTLADCETVNGPGPAVVELEPAAPESTGDLVGACLAVAAHHRVELVNPGDQDLDVTVGSAAFPVGAGASQVTDPVGIFLAPGANQVVAGSEALTTLWLVERSQHPLAGAPIGLSSIGAIELGQAPAEVTAAADGLAVPASGAACFQATLEDDPYSPLFTFRDGLLVVVQVYDPALTTRSGVAVGSSRDEVVAAYGDQLDLQADPAGRPDRELLVFVPQDEEDRIYRLVFDLEAGVVDSIRLGAVEIAATEPDCPS